MVMRLSLFLLLYTGQLFAQDFSEKCTRKNLFGNHLLFIERTEWGNTDLYIAKVSPADSLRPADTLFIDTVALSSCTWWEFDYDMTAGAWELHHDSLIVWYYREATLASDAGHIDPPLVQSWKKIYIIRKNMQVICLGTHYGKYDQANNPALHEEIRKKTAHAWSKLSCH